MEETVVVRSHLGFRASMRTDAHGLEALIRCATNSPPVRVVRQLIEDQFTQGVAVLVALGDREDVVYGIAGGVAD